jgi:hypothetical protein
MPYKARPRTSVAVHLANARLATVLAPGPGRPSTRQLAPSNSGWKPSIVVINAGF